MPPCPAQNGVGSSNVVDTPLDASKIQSTTNMSSASSTASTSSSTSAANDHKTARPTNGMFDNTFHWELNFYSFTFLVFLYNILPVEYRGYMKFVFAVIAMDAARYYYMKGSMHGCPYTLPFVTVAAMLIRPERFWAEMANIALASPDGLCTNQLVGKFLVFVTNPKTCRQIMAGEGTYQIYAHPNALWLFGEKNLIYLDKDPHKDLRRILTPALFGNDALEYYATCQEKVISAYMDKYAKQCEETGKPIDLRLCFRSMAAAASQESFMGPYLTDELRVQLEHDILEFTMGFLSPPIPSAFGLKTAIDAKDRIEEVIQSMVPKSKAYVAAGNEPRCLLERWAVSITETAKEKGVKEDDLLGCDEENIGRTVLDFLFAAQDATNSALTYAADVLEARPDVMEKMEAEVESSLGRDAKNIYTKLFRTEELSYTQKVSNQMLHHKPPVPMIPHLSLKASHFDNHYIPKGTVSVPSLFYAARESGSSTDFLPDREDQDTQFMKCMTFGAGQHKCPGRKYAETQLSVFLAIVSTQYRFERVGDRPNQDEFIYFPTLFPCRNDYMLKRVTTE
eukprot:CAMPEP_0113513376 /NCGR_PEP_ID=MMETSP0014_2-20120614/39828_1 /TAXON_ID=2857 /ORGANISM="Nitzschia sp." /LENGTH=565 /DNA_ID=CAMNT_0000409773 /DNA_START=227 /DNA_END=1924 /DNA_ORIENTATION=- /assembly_acc=CAM_ASM_000159